MLVLSRKRLETLLIGPDIQVRVLSVGPSRVVLGIEAPDSVRVARVVVPIETRTAGSVDSQETADSPSKLKNPLAL